MLRVINVHLRDYTGPIVYTSVKDAMAEIEMYVRDNFENGNNETVEITVGDMTQEEINNLPVFNGY